MNTLALVIGNNNYYKGSELENAVNDANGIADIFTRLGFDLIVKLNCLAKDITDLLSEFESRIGNYDASIFYFAGHGFEIDGENYLAAIDCQVATPNKYHCGQTCIKLNDVLQILKKNSNKVNIVIVDACRKSFDRSTTIAFSPIQSPKGTLIAFSTSPNEGASDRGFEGHSIYTGAILKYIGRERLSVEELFKKVRKTVYNLSEGKQTSWEHTSLIGDYYFNTGQLVYSLSIPYDENVVKDANYTNTTEFGKLIMDLKSYDWNKQNPAITKALRISPNLLDKNQQFILGRNLLQVSDVAFNARPFFQNIERNIGRYSNGGENHLLNGILFEIYFNSHGEFRKEKTKKHFFNEIIALRKVADFRNSFHFILQLLVAEQYPLIYLPIEEDEICDIDIIATAEKVLNTSNEEVTYQTISKITFNTIDITREIAKYQIYGRKSNRLAESIADFLSAPLTLIQLNCSISLNNVKFTKEIIDEEESSGW